MVTNLGYKRPSKRGSILGTSDPPPHRVQTGCGPTHFPPLRVPQLFLAEYSDLKIKLITFDHFSPCKAEFKVSGYTPPLRHMPSWRAQQLYCPTPHHLKV